VGVWISIVGIQVSSVEIKVSFVGKTHLFYREYRTLLITFSFTGNTRLFCGNIGLFYST